MHSCSGQCGPSSSWDKGHCISSSCNFKDLPVTICCSVGWPLSSQGMETLAAMFSGSSAGSMAVTSTNAIVKPYSYICSKTSSDLLCQYFRHYLSVLLSGRGEVFSCSAVYDQV